MHRAAIFCPVLLACAGAAPEPIRVTTHLVEVSVVVRTKQGEPVAGLSREDFSLFDQGRQEKIAFLRSAPDAAPAQRRPIPANLFSNRIAGAGANATVILFDGLNTRLTDQAYAKEQILKFIRQLRPGDNVALYVMGRGPRVIQDFTNDPSLLANALANHKGGIAASLDSPMYDPAVTGPEHFASWLGELSFGLFDYYGEDRAFRTVRALTAIAEHLERVPGRKNLVWVAGSFPVSLAGESVAAPRKSAPDRRNASPETERAARALSKANLAIYPVDARGLMAAQEYAGSMAQPKLKNPDTSEFGTMQMLAERTGGRAFYNNNDLAAALRRASDDAQASYTIGYYPSHREWNGRFRNIEVRAVRPDVELHYRRGYFAQPDEPADSWYRERVLDAAIWSPLESTGVGLTLAATPSAAGGLDLALQVDAPDVAFRRDGDHWLCELDVWLVQLDGKERRLKTDARTNNLRLDESTYKRVMDAKGLLLPEHLSPDPGARLLRVLVPDVATGTMGSLTVPLTR